MEGLHRALQEALAHKRFFIVLDDVWEEDPEKWDSLKGILNCGGKGSWINENVAKITGTLQSFRPPYLSDDKSWDLLSKTAFTPGVKKPEELVEIGKAITNKCGGLPLAPKMLGHLLHMKNDTRQWLQVKESNIWDTETCIIPALWLSYKHLPLHAKRCFTFCAMFPKDHDMEKEELINMWMAHGFIPSDGGRFEVKGNEIFNQLVQRSFFQNVEVQRSYADEISIGSKTICRMHDLVHDLAQYIVGNECIALSPEQPLQVITVPNNVYHLWIPHDRLDIESTLEVSPNFRTIMLHHHVNYNVNMNFPGSTSLRVLSVGRLPTSIKSAQHLRYLKLVNVQLSELPESICTLVNLQTLDLSGSWNLRRLPAMMASMINLRHLYLDECDRLWIMAPGMGRMTNLQTLTLYVVNKGRGIGELKELRLSSQLTIKGLGFVEDAKEAREMNLHSKDLTFLSLDWRGGGPGGGPITNAEQVLKELKPPGCLNFLKIWNYGGSKYPKWMADRLLLQHLVRLRLDDCRGLHRLPPLWQLNSLEELSLEHMDNLKYIISDDNASDDDTSVKAFRSLKELTLSNLRKLEEWWEKRNAPLQEEEDEEEEEEEAMANCLFPALVRLKIFACPELAGSIPLAPYLRSLEIREWDNMTGGLSARLVPQLEELRVHDCLTLKTLPPIWGPSLKQLTVFNCPNLVSLAAAAAGQELCCLSSLEDIYISGCPSLESLGMDGLTALRFLTLVDCSALTSLPERLLPNLTYLSVFNCPQLYNKFQIDGEYWSLIANIPDCEIEAD